MAHGPNDVFEVPAKRIRVPGGYRFSHHALSIPDWIFVPLFWVVEDLEAIARRRYQSPLSDVELRAWVASGARGGIVPLVKFTGRNSDGIAKFHPNATAVVLLGVASMRADEWHVPVGVKAQALIDFDCYCIEVNPPRLPLRERSQR